MRRILLFSCALLVSAMAVAQTTYKNVYSAKQDWSTIYDYFKMDDAVSPYNGLTLDDSGNVYITGSSVKDTLGNTAAFYNKYGPNGTMIWNNANDTDITQGNAIVWDSVQQRLYGCGTRVTSFGAIGLSGEYILNMIGTNDSNLGEFIWPDPNATKRLPHYAGAENLCEDKAGDIYVTGFISGYLSYGVMNHNMLTTYKIDGTDTVNAIKWMSSYDSTNLLEEEGQYIALDPDNNVYVCGIRGDSLKNYQENLSLLCVKYDGSGNIEWSRKFINTDTFFLTTATGLAVSNSGSAYMSGNIPNKGAVSMDGIILKYNNQGKLAWDKRFSSLMLHTQDAACNGIMLDKIGNLFAAGYVETDSGEYATLVKLDSNGNVLWMDTLKDAASSGALVSDAIALTLDDTGNVYVAGTRGDNQTFQDVYTARYNSAGQKQWYIRYNDSVLSSNTPIAIKVDKQGNVIVAGGHNGDTITGEDILVLKYSQYMTKVKIVDTNSSIKNILPATTINIFPNPFSDHLNGAFDLDETSTVNLTFYDLTGRELNALSYPNLPAGQSNFKINMDNLSKGLYFYRCTIINQDGAITQNGKIEKQ